MKAMKKLTLSIILATTSALVSTNILWFQAYRTERKISDLAVGIDLSQADRQAVLPEIVRRVYQGEDAEVSITYLNFAFDLEASINRETETSEKPEQIAAQLELLEQQLSKRQIGKIELLLSHSANLYTPGAIQTTYDLLMGPNGHHADPNGDGRINSPEELDRLPCQTSIDIEKLWREHTDDRRLDRTQFIKFHPAM